MKTHLHPPPPEDIARYEPIRAARAPAQCHRGTGAGPCWVKSPYDALKPGSAACAGCNKPIGSDKPPSAKELAAVGGKIA